MARFIVVKLLWQQSADSYHRENYLVVSKSERPKLLQLLTRNIWHIDISDVEVHIEGDA